MRFAPRVRRQPTEKSDRNRWSQRAGGCIFLHTLRRSCPTERGANEVTARSFVYICSQSPDGPAQDVCANSAGATRQHPGPRARSGRKRSQRNFVGHDREARHQLKFGDASANSTPPAMRCPNSLRLSIVWNTLPTLLSDTHGQEMPLLQWPGAPYPPPGC